MNKKQLGFTIIELIVVIAIIAVLAGIVLVNVTQYINKAKNAKRLSDVQNYVKAFNMYYADKGVEATKDYLGECCLGDFGTDDCLWGSSIVQCATVNNLIKSYIPGLPVTKDTVLLSGQKYNAYFLRCNDVPDACVIYWFLSGENQNCGNYPDGYWTGEGVTQCAYLLQYK